MLTDAEILSQLMEPDAPENGGRPGIDQLQKYSPGGWWRYSALACNWKVPILSVCPKIEQLGWVHLVEAKLSDEQCNRYVAWFQLPPPLWYAKVLLHADAPTKIRALAEVLRDAVDQKGPSE